MRSRSRAVGLAGAGVAAGAVVLALVLPAGPAGAAGSTYRRTNLVSDVPGRAQVTDPNLVNAWGLSYGPGTPLWVADNGTGRARSTPVGSTAARRQSPRSWSRSRAAHRPAGVQPDERVRRAQRGRQRARDVPLRSARVAT